MKIALTALGFIALAFLATGLLEFDFFTKFWLRQSLVWFLTIGVLVSGFWVIRAMARGKE